MNAALYYLLSELITSRIKQYLFVGELFASKFNKIYEQLNQIIFIHAVTIAAIIFFFFEAKHFEMSQYRAVFFIVVFFTALHRYIPAWFTDFLFSFFLENPIINRFMTASCIQYIAFYISVNFSRSQLFLLFLSSVQIVA